MYRTLGCFHSLQPTRSAFEAPSIPCLTDDGFVRFQTLQILLCPQEFAPMMQRAVQIYDVPKRGGGYFPKSMPVDCFPAKPDAEMEKWHRFVTSQMNQDYVRRLKYSPYASPAPEANGSGEYFSRPVSSRRPSGSKRRTSMSEEDLAKVEAARRRSSVPDILSPGGTPLYMSERDPAEKVRSHSSNRTTSSGQRPRASTATYQYPRPERASFQNPPPRRDNGESMDRDRRRDARHLRNFSSSSRPGSSSSSSTDDNRRSRKPRSSEDERPRRPRWGSSLMPSFFLSNSKRRHSSDGRVPTLSSEKGRSPRRSDSIRKSRSDGPSDPHLGRSPNRTSRSNPKYNEFEMSPRPDEQPYATPPSSYRYPEPQSSPYQASYAPPKGRTPSATYGSPYSPTGPPNNQPPSFEASFTSGEARKYGAPLRVNTMGGVNGRRYVPADSRSSVEPRNVRRDRTASLRNPATASVV